MSTQHTSDKDKKYMKEDEEIIMAWCQCYESLLSESISQLSLSLRNTEHIQLMERCNR